MKSHIQDKLNKKQNKNLTNPKYNTATTDPHLTTNNRTPDSTIFYPHLPLLAMVMRDTRIFTFPLGVTPRVFLGKKRELAGRRGAKHAHLVK